MMDNIRGQDDIGNDEAMDYGAIEAPPSIDVQERRMHVRAYNYWVSLLGNRALPSIEDLNPEDMEDFSANSVLLDFSLGLENPAILYLGSALRDECGVTGKVERVDEVPSRSLLSRLTDHYLQIIANAAPVGFEAEFINQRDSEIMYRGILMPFSSDDETIDFIYGVISWKEVASQTMLDGLDEEVKAAISNMSAASSSSSAPIWADGPSATVDFDDEDGEGARYPANIADMEADDFGFTDMDAKPSSSIGAAADFDVNALSADTSEESRNADRNPDNSDTTASRILPDEDMSRDARSGLDELDLSAFMAAEQSGKLTDALSGFDEFDAAPDAGKSGMDDGSDHYDSATPVATDSAASSDNEVDSLAGALDLARQSAAEVRDADARSRAALYRAIGHAHDFALDARDAQEAYAALLDQAGITVQDRSPMTAVIKLVFGVDYDKTRIAEYALALEYALLEGLPHGSFAATLASYEGGLKGLVQDMRDARNGDQTPRAIERLERAYRKIGKAQRLDAGALAFDDQGVALVVARREEDGSVSFVASIDTQEKSAQKLLIAASKAI